MRRLISIGVVAAGTVLLIAFFVFLRKPVVDPGANGLFANDFCGTIKLADGEMLLNDQQTISYIVRTSCRALTLASYPIKGSTWMERARCASCASTGCLQRQSLHYMRV
jgi:hypothetical protein